MARDDRAGDSGDVNTFIGLDKSKVIQDVRIFSETPLNVRRCTSLLTKALYLVYRGNGESDSTVFDRGEATRLFFAVTKTFQCKDSRLKKLTFLAVRELAGMADDVIIVISSLTQDITTRSEPVIRANAIRALGAVTDGSLVGGIERFIKQCMLDREQLVSSAALVTAIRFYDVNQEAVRRWVPEAQQCLSQAKDISQFHAVVLLLLLKQGDRMACVKLVREILAMPTHPLTACALLQTYDHLCHIGFVQHGTMLLDLAPFLKYKGKSDMVALEAARIICSHSKTLYAKDLQYAVNTLGSFLSSVQVPSVFAALRTLSRLAMTVPEMVAPLNAQLEKMVTHANRNVATLAVTTLLKTGNDSSIDSLLSKIGDYVSDVSDEFRVTIVEAVHKLCLRFPAKHQSMLEFLGKTLREEGGLEYKTCTVNAICDLLAAIPRCRDAALQHLCEFIEDSEHARLTIRVIYVLAEEAPKTANASLIVRCISNRLILEETAVRVAAIDALVKIATTVPPLQHGLMTFLAGFADDPEDPVAEHTAIGLRALKRDSPAQFLYPETVYDLDALECRLAAFISGAEKTLRLDDLPVVSVASLCEQVVPEQEEIDAEPAAAAAAEERTAAIPEADAYGPLFTSSGMLALTEAEAEYAVHVIKHVFPHHLVLEFVCQNTVPGQLLASIQADLRTSVPLKIVRTHPIRSLRFGESASAFVAFESEASMKPGLQFQCALRFLAHQCGEGGDVLDAGYPEQYPIGPFDIDLVDYIRPEPQPGPNLNALLRDTFTLTAIDTVQAAARELHSLIGGFPVSSAAEPDGRHALVLSGTIYPSSPFLTTCRLSKNPSAAGVTLDLQIAAADRETAAAIMDLIA